MERRTRVNATHQSPPLFGDTDIYGLPLGRVDAVAVTYTIRGNALCFFYKFIFTDDTCIISDSFVVKVNLCAQNRFVERMLKGTKCALIQLKPLKESSSAVPER